MKKTRENRYVLGLAIIAPLGGFLFGFAHHFELNAKTRNFEEENILSKSMCGLSDQEGGHTFLS